MIEKEDDDGMPFYFDYEIEKEIQLRLGNSNSYHRIFTEISNLEYLIATELHRGVYYERIHETMKLLNWTWGFNGIPSIKTIQDHTLDYILQTLSLVRDKETKDPNYFNDTRHTPFGTGSGGIEVRYHGDDYYTVDFKLTGWSTEYFDSDYDQYTKAKKADERKIKIKNFLDEETN